MVSFARPIRILMIERDSSMVELARTSFELAGLPAVVTVVETREAATTALAGSGHDALLVHLAVVGSSFLDQLRSASGTRKLPIIAMSAKPHDVADYVFARPKDEGDFMGIVAAIKFFWMNEAPSLAPPPPSKPSDPYMPSLPPRRLSHVDLMTLPIEPAEAYLLSILDGEMGVDELSSVMGTSPAKSRKMLRRLAELGAVTWTAPHPSLAPPPPPTATPTSVWPSPGMPAQPLSSPRFPAARTPEHRSPRRPSGTSSRPHDPAPRSSVSRTSAGSSGPGAKAPEPAAEVADARLTDARKRQIDDAYALAEEADHYELLGVSRDATRKEIREAYFTLAKLFHTDTLFGVELGEYRRKMDRVFRQVTEAYDVLGKSKRRRAYDEYLGAVKETVGLEEPLPTPEPPAPSPPLAEVSRSKRRTRSDTMRAYAEHRLRDIRASRRDAQRPPASQGPPMPDALSSLSRALTEVSRASGRQDRADRLIADARTAEASGNYAGAAEALRIAHAWRPKDAALKAEAERLRAEAVRSKAEAFEKRARYAQERMQWDEAATCWAKVADARSEQAEPQEQAAVAALRANSASQSARYAKRAVQLRPDSATGHRLLGMSYAAANKPASARRALEKALSLDPNDREAREQLKQLGG